MSTRGLTASVESPTIDAMSTPTDPMMMFRDMVAQWEKMANDYGGQFLARPETAELMHKATAANLQVQSAMSGAMEKVLGAANMPTKTQIDAIGARQGGQRGGHGDGAGVEQIGEVGVAAEAGIDAERIGGDLGEDRLNEGIPLRRLGVR